MRPISDLGASGEIIDHNGEVYEIPSIAVRPVPARKIPIWIGGKGKVETLGG